VAGPASIGGKAWTKFSAVCWLTGKYLYNRFHIPIGLVSSNWGGTIVQAWSSPQALAQCKMPPQAEATKISDGMSQKYLHGTSYKGPDPNTYSVLWNAMIIPLLGSSIKGVLWYQGESNTIYINDIGPFYECAFPAMINDWRQQWWGTADKTFGFYFVQIATWLDLTHTTLEYTIRLAQDYALNLPKVGMAVAHDLGDPGSPEGDIHPRDKQTVGERLALAIRAIGYGENVQYTGPIAIKMNHAVSGGSLVVSVFFDKTSIGVGLVLVPKGCLVPQHTQCSGFEVCSGNVWVEVASAGRQIIGSYLQLTVPNKGSFCGVRYAANNYPLTYLYNGNGLPAGPFYFPKPF